MVRSDLWKSSSLPGASAGYEMAAPLLAITRLPRNAEQICQENQLQMFTLDGSDGLFAVAPVFLGVWLSFGDVPFVFNYVYRAHTVQTVLP